MGASKVSCGNSGQGRRLEEQERRLFFREHNEEADAWSEKGDRGLKEELVDGTDLEGSNGVQCNDDFATAQDCCCDSWSQEDQGHEEGPLAGGLALDAR